MSALPFRHQVRPARPLQNDGLQGGGSPQPQGIAVPQDGALKSWQSTGHAARRIDSSGTELDSPALRIAVIAALALVFWTMVLTLWHIVASFLP